MFTITPELLEKYARLAIKVGLNLQAGQRLFIGRAPLEAVDLVRAITEVAYKAGARAVHVLWNDEALERTRFQFAPRESFSEFPQWLADAWLQSAQAGDAILMIRGQDPDLLKNADPELTSLAQKVRWQHLRPALDITGSNGTNWLVIAAPVRSWAQRVFPDVDQDQALTSLWDAIVRICRLDKDDPIAAWQQHLAELEKRKQWLNEQRFSHLHYRGPETDLLIGLPSAHIWLGGSSQAQQGFSFVPNLPTEEIFTLPHRGQVEGKISASLPLSYSGQLIKNFKLEFSEGRVVHFTASKGEETLRQLLESDENAGRLGEVALVSHDSPIAKMGRLFFDTLIDENAACHLAFGNAYSITLQGGTDMTPEAFAAAGGNRSLVHVDFMVGSAALDIDGIRADGSKVPVLRQGVWAFDTD